MRLPIAGLLIFGGLAAIAAIYLGMLYAGAEAFSHRTARALRLATAADTVVEQFSGSGATGNVYAKPDGETLLVVISGLPAPRSDEKYQVWFLVKGQVTAGQRMKLDEDGTGRVIMEPVQAAGYDEIRVTREKITAALPEGPVLMTWKKR